MKGLFILIGICALSGVLGAPHHDDDRYSPLIRTLKAIRRRERYQQYYSTNREDDVNTASSNNNNNNNEAPSSSSSSDQQQVTEFLGQRPGGSSSSSSNNFGSGGNYNSGSFSSPEAIQKILAQSQLNNGGGGSSSSNSDRLPNFNIPNLPPVSGGTSVPPQRIEQINRGVSTILGGVGSGSLAEILRGSFMFTRNENVRSVANNVLDSIFGRRSP